MTNDKIDGIIARSKLRRLQTMVETRLKVLDRKRGQQGSRLRKQAIDELEWVLEVLGDIES